MEIFTLSARLSAYASVYVFFVEKVFQEIPAYTLYVINHLFNHQTHTHSLTRSLTHLHTVSLFAHQHVEAELRETLAFAHGSINHSLR